MAEYTQSGGLKKLLKLTKRDIATMYIADLNRFNTLTSTFINSQASPEVIHPEKDNNNKIIFNNDDAVNSCIQRDDSYKSIDLFETFERFDAIENVTNVTDNNVLDVSPTLVFEKTLENLTDCTMVNHENPNEESCLQENTPVAEVTENVMEQTDFQTQRANPALSDPCEVGNLKSHYPILYSDAHSSSSSSSSSSSLSHDLLQRVKVLEEDNICLKEKMYYAEVKSASNDQYSRRNNFEIAGIPDSIHHDKLEGTVINILNELNIKVGWKDIEACHRLRKHPRSKEPARTIIRFVNRKHTIQALMKKKSIRRMKFTNILGKPSRLYINENICPAYRDIYDAAYKHLKNGVIQHLWTFKGVVHIRVNEEDDEILSFVHIEDLRDYFLS